MLSVGSLRWQFSCSGRLTLDVAEQLVQCLDVRVHHTHDERQTEELNNTTCLPANGRSICLLAVWRPLMARLVV